MRGDLFAKSQLKQLAIFRRNIVIIFEGPKDLKFDFKDIKFRKKSTCKKWELIQGLSLDGVILWAIAFASTVWAGKLIALDVFTCFFDNIKPKLVQT